MIICMLHVPSGSMLTFLLMVSLTAWSVQEGLSGVMHISLPYPLIHLHTVSSPLVARGALYARRAQSWPW